MTTLAARLATNPGADRIRLMIGTAFVEHVDDLWPQREPNATPEWIRAHVDEILGLLEQFLRRDGRDVHRLPHRLHWVLWLLVDLDANQSV